MNIPLLSILLPVFNTEKYLAQAIDSILNQTFQDFELIIADDGSTDHSLKIIESYTDSRIKNYPNNKNKGKSATINSIYQYAKGKYLTIHDADDISEPTRFEKQITYLEANPKAGLCGTNFSTVTADGNLFSQTVMNPTHQSILNDIRKESQFHGPTVVFRKELVDQLDNIYRPYFNDNFEDIDLCYRVLSLSEGANLSDHLYQYRILEDSLCRKNVDVKNRNLYSVVYHLFQQRQIDSKDDLMKGNIEAVDDFFDTQTIQYKKDSSLIHREAAAYYMYWNLKKKAIQESIIAVKKNPLNLINLRTLIYCLRK